MFHLFSSLIVLKISFMCFIHKILEKGRIINWQPLHFDVTFSFIFTPLLSFSTMWTSLTTKEFICMDKKYQGKKWEGKHIKKRNKWGKRKKNQWNNETYTYKHRHKRVRLNKCNKVKSLYGWQQVIFPFSFSTFFFRCCAILFIIPRYIIFFCVCLSFLNKCCVQAYIELRKKKNRAYLNNNMMPQLLLLNFVWSVVSL